MSTEGGGSQPAAGPHTGGAHGDSLDDHGQLDACDEALQAVYDAAQDALSMTMIQLERLQSFVAMSARLMGRRAIGLDAAAGNGIAVVEEMVIDLAKAMQRIRSTDDAICRDSGSAGPGQGS